MAGPCRTKAKQPLAGPARGLAAPHVPFAPGYNPILTLNISQHMKEDRWGELEREER